MAAHRLVFVCLHGAAKSVMAAAYCRQLAAAQGVPVEAASGGIEPDPEVPPTVVAGLLADGIDVRGVAPRRVTWEELTTATRVIAFGCDLGGIGPPDLPVEQWDDVPPASEDFGRARDAILARLRLLLDTCTGSSAARPALSEAGADLPPSRRDLLRGLLAVVRFKPISGQEDASGGIVFRFEHGRYYVVRANALEGNFRLYYYDRGRHEIASARTEPPALGRWHTLRVVAVGDHVQASLNDRLLLDHRDTRFRMGQVGLWTKADSVTAFDDVIVRGIVARG